MSLRVRKILSDYTRKAKEWQAHLLTVEGEPQAIGSYGAIRALWSTDMGSFERAARAPYDFRTEGVPESLCFPLTDGIIPPSAESKATQENIYHIEEDRHKPGSSERSKELCVSPRDVSVEPRTKAWH
jgi:hypothetical protein